MQALNSIKFLLQNVIFWIFSQKKREAFHLHLETIDFKLWKWKKYPLSRGGHHQHLTSLFLICFCLILQVFLIFYFSLILQFFTFLIFFLAVPWQFLVSLILLHYYFSAWSWEEKSGMKLLRDMYQSGKWRNYVELSVKALILTYCFHPLSSTASGVQKTGLPED